MALIKELKAINKPPKGMIKYFHDGAIENDLRAFYNTGLAQTEQELTKAFIEDSKFKNPKSKNYRHVLLSFSPEDNEAITEHPELLMDMLDRYVNLRGYNKGLCYFVLHRPERPENSGAIHWHGLISTHVYQSSKSLRNELSNFVSQNKALEHYQQEKWGHVLKKSIAYIDKDKPQDKKLKRIPRSNHRDFVIQTYNKIADKSSNLSDFYKRIEREHPEFTPYETSKGKINGCKYKSLKWRISTHMDKERYQMLLDLEQLKNIREKQQKERGKTR